ncbi:hypothetical protein L2E82_08406 [Cichorium intybus]|uniref:Uncharacterized protein n=1 Tax=Cichorium intybus TaxID=13427 RepID=A0ACB9G6E7_CICIN|nr:hypothetical protein L2E82_08406 [Cichorium intybus]
MSFFRGWLEEIERKQYEMMTSQVASEQLHQKYRLLKTENEMFKTGTANLKIKVIDLETEVIRSRLQEQGQNRNPENHYAGVVDCVKKVFQKEGVAGFYRGCATNLIRTTPSAVITFTSYEMINRFLQHVLPPHKTRSKPTNGKMKPPLEPSGNDATDLQISKMRSNNHSPRTFIPLGNQDQVRNGQ